MKIDLQEIMDCFKRAQNCEKALDILKYILTNSVWETGFKHIKVSDEYYDWRKHMQSKLSQAIDLIEEENHD